jgi:hypothetical protein
VIPAPLAFCAFVKSTAGTSTVIFLAVGIRSSWRLDAVMNEEQDRTRMGHGPAKLAVLRQTAINAIEKEGSKGSLLGKFRRASWNKNYL